MPWSISVFSATIKTPVEFNFSTAEGFSSQLRWTSQRINIFDARTSLAESIASREFRGFFATVFALNIQVCSADAMALSEALSTAADMVDYLCLLYTSDAADDLTTV